MGEDAREREGRDVATSTVTTTTEAERERRVAEGGAVVCKDAELANRVYLLKKFGHFGEDQYIDVGINAKMSELHAAMGLCVGHLGMEVDPVAFDEEGLERGVGHRGIVAGCAHRVLQGHPPHCADDSLRCALIGVAEPVCASGADQDLHR